MKAENRFLCYNDNEQQHTTEHGGVSGVKPKPEHLKVAVAFSSTNNWDLEPVYLSLVNEPLLRTKVTVTAVVLITILANHRRLYFYVFAIGLFFVFKITLTTTNRFHTYLWRNRYQHMDVVRTSVGLQYFYVLILT